MNLNEGLNGQMHSWAGCLCSLGSSGLLKNREGVEPWQTAVNAQLGKNNRYPLYLKVFSPLSFPPFSPGHRVLQK